MLYGYGRCSTNEDKQDVKRQLRELKQCGVSEENVFLEYASGTKADREQLNRLFSTVQAGDTIFTTEVSRLSRSTAHLCKIIETIQEKKIKLVIKDSITIDCTGDTLDPMTKAFLQISGVFAELERDMISARVKSGLRNAADKGKKLGRPHATAEDIPAVFYRHYPAYQAGNLNISEFARICNKSRTTIYKYLRLVKDN